MKIYILKPGGAKRAIPKEDDMTLFLLGLTSGMLLMVLISIVMVGKRVRRLKEEQRIVRERFDTTVAEFESHLRRLAGKDSVAIDKETLS